MRFYLASSLKNAETAKKIAEYLNSRGWSQTYDWTAHGAMSGFDELERVSGEELNGVTGCDVFFLLLPGRRGSHAELGAALATKKPVIILAPDQDMFFEAGSPCSFYYHSGVWEKIIDRDWFALACMAHRAGKKLERKSKRKERQHETN